MLHEALEALPELVLPHALVGVARKAGLEAVEGQLVGMAPVMPVAANTSVKLSLM